MKYTRFTILLLCMVILTGCGSKAMTNKLPEDTGTSADTQSVSETPSEADKADNVPAASDNAEEEEDNGEIVEIKEKMFITQCNDIYLNPDDYKDRTIKLEGIYNEYTNTTTNKTYHYVIRYGPGCCGNDGVAGFEILYDGTLPEKNDWIKVAGKVEMIEEDGDEYVALRLSELTVSAERGAERVLN